MYRLSGSSSMLSGRAANYASDGAAFAHMDDDGEEEFVAIELTDQSPGETVATISTWGEEGRAFEWTSEPLGQIRRLVVGNIDGDPLHEMVLFGEWSGADSAYDTINVVQWNGSSYEVTGSDQLSPRLGALLDVDSDGRQEIVLAVVPDPHAEMEGTEPVTLMIARYTEDGWARVFDHDIRHGVMALAAGDLDGDGRDEIVVSERSGDEQIDGQIVVYGVDPERGIERRVGYNRMVRSVSFLGVFESSGQPYLFVEQGGDAWKSVFRLMGSRDTGFKLAALKANRTGIFVDALRSTMAYSAERRSHARFLDRSTIQFVPVEFANLER